METRARYIMVGSFVLFLLVGLVVAVMWIARVELQQSVAYYDIYFAGSVTGLTAGSAVRDNGIAVGRVTEIKLDPKDPTEVRVTVEINGGTVIKSDAVASLETQGLTGAAYINITGGSREAAPVTRAAGERYPVIASAPSGLQRVVTSAPEALARLIALTDELNDMLNEHNRQAIADTLENVRRLTAAMASHTGEIDSAISDGTAALHDLRSTLESAQAILVSLNAVIAPSGDMTSAIKSVSDTSRKFANVADRLDSLLAQNDPQLTSFLRQGPSQLEQLVAQSQALVAQLSRIAETIERDPSRIIYGDRRQGYQPP
jgi:phospholipid/cholesterol/gamma-HCH transport system substrate-binding protein